MPLASVNGAALHYQERGSGPPLLFLHGTGASSFIWERSIARLPAGNRLISYDRRGFGASRGSRARSLREHVADAAGLLGQLDAAPAVVITQSGGSPIAMRLAVDHPQMVSALVMAEPAYQVALHPSLSVTRAMTAMLGRWALRRDVEAAALGYYRWASRLMTGGSTFDGYPEAWRETAVGHSDATVREVLQLVVPWPRARAVRQISCPVTLVVGDIGEPVFRRTTRRVQRLLPHARTVEAHDTSHLIPADQPDEFAEAVAGAVAAAVGE